VALTLPNASRSAMCDALVGQLDGGTIEIRSGTRPASANDTATGSLLAAVTLKTPAFGAASNGVATINDPDPVTASASGTATWFRALTSEGGTVFDGSVTATGGGGDLTLVTTSLTNGLSVDVTGGTVTMPGS
jgi:hypothetical protein